MKSYDETKARHNRSELETSVERSSGLGSRPPWHNASQKQTRSHHEDMHSSSKKFEENHSTNTKNKLDPTMKIYAFKLREG